MNVDLTDEDLKLLQSLEDEGLLSKNVASRVRTALRIANVAGKNRTRASIIVGLVVLACCLASAAVAAPFDFLKVLCGTLTAACLAFAIGTAIATWA